MNLYRIIANGSALACALLALALAWVLARQYVLPPPFSFSQPVYAPVRPNVCPGDTLEWNPSLRVTRVPTVLAVSRTLWDVTNRRTLQPDSQLDFFVWTETDKGEIVSRPTFFKVPLSLPAGFYEVRAGASAFNSDAAAYRVPFVVKDTCHLGVK
jgi:hypothetical protein